MEAIQGVEREGVVKNINKVREVAVLAQTKEMTLPPSCLTPETDSPTGKKDCAQHYKNEDGRLKLPRQQVQISVSEQRQKTDHRHELWAEDTGEPTRSYE